MLRIGAGGLLALLLVGLTAWAGPAALAKTTRPAAGRAARTQPAYPYNFSRIAWTGHDSVIAATDSHGDLYYFWEAAGSTTWHRQLVAKGGAGVAYNQASIAWTKHGVDIAAVDDSQVLVYFHQPSGHTKWSSEGLESGSGLRTPSVTTAANGSVLIVVRNTEGYLVWLEQGPSGTGWTSNAIANAVPGSYSAATSPDGSDAYLGLITAVYGGSVYFWWSVLGTTDWHEEIIASAGAGVSYASASVIGTSDDVLVAAATTAGAVDFWSQSIGGTGWTEQGVGNPGSGGAYANPVPAWNGMTGAKSRYYIAATDHSGDVEVWSSQGGGQWHRERVATAGKQAAYATVGISVTKTSAILTAINRKTGNVIYWYQRYGTSPWHKQQVAKG